MALLAGPAQRGDALLLEQTGLLAGASGVDAAGVDALRRTLSSLIERAKDPAPSQAELQGALRGALLAAASELPQGIYAILDPYPVMLASPWMRAFLAYDPARDFSFLSLLTTAPLALVARADLPEGAAFFEAAVQQGDRWNYGSVGAGSVAHLGMEQLKLKVPGLKAVHVPYQGNPAVLTALLGGQIHMALVPPGLAMPHVKSGRLQVIGLTGGRSTLVPELGALSELGVKNFNLEVWTALIGPSNLSKAAQLRLAQEVPAVVRSATTRQRLFSQGWNAVGSSPEGLRLRVADESAILGGIIRSANIKAE
ncbi:MAG: tripartite tricarboxylate transporter substrate binding protein [Betaproteobacteria bacterium]|nr:tripartite tricarboxylate transporter substrate binding protein [Betaproteobacteria bacterium]